MSPLVSIIISALSDFVIAAGGALISGVVASEIVALPNAAVWLISLVTGLMATARTLKATFEPAATTKTTVTEASGASSDVIQTAAPGAPAPTPAVAPTAPKAGG